MDIQSTCKNGTTRNYSCLNYNQNGELLASQGGHPDYTLTIWDWKTSSVVLKSHSFPADVLNIKFSNFNDRQLVCGGVGHIKLWEMCRTFTGLKLSNIDGRFGRADICDVIGLCPMPDESILSNSKCSNILVWNGENIKFEVCQKNRKSCHDGSITQIFFKDGEVMTIGEDGFIRIWFWETVDLADPPDSDLYVEIDPTFEYRLEANEHICKILSMVQDHGRMRRWYAQDGNGGIWMCDLDASRLKDESTLLFRCHAGSIVGLDSSPFSTHIVTLGVDGRLHLYDYVTDELLFYHQFPAEGRDLIWVPLTVFPLLFIL